MDVRFTYDINGILMVDTRVVSTGVVKTHIISQKIPEAELEELLQKNPEICIVTNELGYGVVPIEPFDRKWREKTGRICTELAAKADSVTRVVCGIGILLKGEEKHD